MATTGLVLSLFLFLAISAFVQIASADGVPAFYAASGSRHLGQIDCGSACDYRCSKASFQDRCLKYCNICCTDCNCVPPGTAGNKEVCPCYNNKKNSKGGPKCP